MAMIEMSRKLVRERRKACPKHAGHIASKKKIASGRDRRDPAWRGVT
jgi:hypothetical protein